MASLNLSINGPSIKNSYQSVVNGSFPSSSSSTYGQWALFSVQAPLLNAFQNTGSKESVLKVETSGEGELADLIEEFSEGRIQFAFVKVKDPNTGLPKNVLIAWCGGGVPERTKGYFTSHLAAVSKVLHGYHVQLTARSDSDLEPAAIMQKVADASGAKYTSGGSAPLASAAPPPVAKKPVFTPTTSSTSTSFNPLVASRTRRQETTDDDGWGEDAPQVTRTGLEKVESAYKPTKVNMAELVKQNREPSRFNGDSRKDDQPSDIVKGGYQPVGKVDIAAIRAQAHRPTDDRPTAVKGAYEPVGKVDIAAIRARAQRPPDEPTAQETPEQPKSLAERSAAFTQSERLTELPKPKPIKQFGTSAFSATKPPTPGNFGLGSSPSPAPPAAGSTARTFADQGGKTPAQIWAEKKAKERGTTAAPAPAASPVAAQKSGSEWKSGYSGKSWAPVQAPGYSRAAIETQETGGTEKSEPQVPASPGGGVSALRDRFKDSQIMGDAVPAAQEIPTPSEDESVPPPLPTSTRPSGGFALPGLPTRPAADNQEEAEAEEAEIEEAPPAPSRGFEEKDEHSPIRIAVPVARSSEPEPEIEPPEERIPERPVPVEQIEEELPREEELTREEESYDPRAAAAAVAAQSFGQGTAADSHAGTGSGKSALVQYDYEKAEDNEIDLRDGEHVTDIDMVDDDWWLGTNPRGERGLFPSNYVELVEGVADASPPPAPITQHEPEPEPKHEPAADADADGATATALYDYEAAEDNELGFPEGAKITKLEFPDEDWWFGHFNGASGLFPANYVQLDG